MTWHAVTEYTIQLGIALTPSADFCGSLLTVATRMRCMIYIVRKHMCIVSFNYYILLLEEELLESVTGVRVTLQGVT